MLYVILVYLFFTYPIFRKISNKKVVIFLEIFPMFLILAFQNAIGTDYYNYIRIFNGEKIFTYSRGPIFKLIIIYLKSIFDNERLMFITTAAIQMILFYKILYILYVRKFIKNIPLFIFLSITVSSFYFEMFNILRNTIASLFIVLSILALLENKNKKSLYLNLLGSGFHPSVIIWNGIFIFKRLFYKKHRIKLIIFILICFILNRLNFIQNLAKILYETEMKIPYKHYLISKHMFPYTKSFGIATIINIIIFIFSLDIVYKREKNKNKIFIYNLGYLFFGLQLFFANVPIFSRLLGPSNLLKTFIIYKLVEKLLNKKYLYLGIVLIFYYILYFIRGSFLIVPAT